MKRRRGKVQHYRSGSSSPLEVGTELTKRSKPAPPGTVSPPSVPSLDMEGAHSCRTTLRKVRGGRERVWVRE